MRLDSPLPAEGVKVPIYATFTGWKGAPLLAVATNSFSPLLRLSEDRVEFKVIRSHARPLGDIERVHAWRWRRTNQVTIEWSGTPWTLTANLLLPRDLEQVLVFFARKAVPLSDEARALRLPPGSRQGEK